ncbi:MAG: Rpn family recombination-promoting nuclease/putative transposase [Treponemataceae bacterium]|nr:Rpn family recombination-promoting nuclease/putative transposase [Treponemataceae bacterium]
MEKQTLRPSPDALLNPRYDANFKAIFSEDSEEGRLALKSFLQAVLNAQVSDIQLIQNELPIEAEYDKRAVFDISCTLDGRRHVNIEMQGLNIDNAYDCRAEYQAAHLLNHCVKRGMNWRNAPDVYQVSVLNFIYDKESDKGVSMYTMRAEDGRTLAGKMTVVFVELPKYKNAAEKVEDLTAVEKWCKFLLYADDGAKRSLIGEICKSDGGIMAASGILTKISQDDINWARQTSIDIWERDQLTNKSYMEELTRELAEKRAELEKNHAALEKKDAALEEKDAALAESHAALAEKDAQLLAQMREIELLRAKLANKKATEDL